MSGSNAGVSLNSQRSKRLKQVMKVKKRKARCQKVLAILGNEIKTLECLREETYPSVSDWDADGSQVMVCRLKGAGSFDEVMIPMSCVIFLK